MALFSDFKQLFYTFIVLSISLKVKLNINQCREILFYYHFLDKNALTFQLFLLAASPITLEKFDFCDKMMGKRLLLLRKGKDDNYN